MFSWMGGWSDSWGSVWVHPQWHTPSEGSGGKGKGSGGTSWGVLHGSQPEWHTPSGVSGEGWGGPPWWQKGGKDSDQKGKGKSPGEKGGSDQKGKGKSPGEKGGTPGKGKGSDEKGTPGKGKGSDEKGTPGKGKPKDKARANMNEEERKQANWENKQRLKAKSTAINVARSPHSMAPVRTRDGQFNYPWGHRLKKAHRKLCGRL